jgi:hypothetical protein
MPFWIEEEVQSVAGSSNDTWRERYEILGGIPRVVLEDAIEDATKILEEACRN